MTQPHGRKSVRLGARQAETLLQLSAGWVIVSAKNDPYKALRAKGLVEDRTSYMRGDVEYERKNQREVPTVTLDGQQALREHVQKHGRLELEMQTPFAEFTTVIRMDPVPA